MQIGSVITTYMQYLIPASGKRTLLIRIMHSIYYLTLAKSFTRHTGYLQDKYCP